MKGKVRLGGATLGRLQVAGRDDPWRRVQMGVVLLAAVVILGTAGYAALGLGPLDALYQTVTTVSTVGYRELGEADAEWKVFTVALILVGVGVALYTLSVLLETIVEGRLTDRLGRLRMEREIAEMTGHVIVCGWGRVGRTISSYLQGTGGDVVVVEQDPDRASAAGLAIVTGDATDDEVLVSAGIDRAATLIAALDTDAANLYVTLSARSRRPDLFILARARVDSAEPKLLQAGANRVVNPQLIGGARMAALATQPHVADFLDVVMHDGSLEFRLEEVLVPQGSALAGESLGEAGIQRRTGAMVLAVRKPSGAFVTNPPPDEVMTDGHVLIAIGTAEQLDALAEAAGPR